MLGLIMPKDYQQCMCRVTLKIETSFSLFSNLSLESSKRKVSILGARWSYRRLPTLFFAFFVLYIPLIFGSTLCSGSGSPLRKGDFGVESSTTGFVLHSYLPLFWLLSWTPNKVLLFSPFADLHLLSLQLLTEHHMSRLNWTFFHESQSLPQHLTISVQGKASFSKDDWVLWVSEVLLKRI